MLEIKWNPEFLKQQKETAALETRAHEVFRDRIKSLESKDLSPLLIKQLEIQFSDAWVSGYYARKNEEHRPRR